MVATVCWRSVRPSACRAARSSPRRCWITPALVSGPPVDLEVDAAGAGPVGEIAADGDDGAGLKDVGQAGGRELCLGVDVVVAAEVGPDGGDGICRAGLDELEPHPSAAEFRLADLTADPDPGADSSLDDLGDAAVELADGEDVTGGPVSAGGC